MTNIITLGVKNQAPQVSFKNSIVGDYTSISSHNLYDMKCCDFLDILDAISYYGSHTFTLNGPVPHFLSYIVTCSFPQNASKNGGHNHSLGADITTFGSISQAPKDSFGPDLTFLGPKFKSEEHIPFSLLSDYLNCSTWFQLFQMTTCPDDSFGYWLFLQLLPCILHFLSCLRSFPKTKEPIMPFASENTHQ